MTALHVACQLGRAKCAELLLSYGPLVNSQTESGSTALHYACAQGHATCVELLLAAGAKCHLVDILQQTPKEVARLSAIGDWELCVKLIEEEEIRFGFKVLKTAGAVALTCAAIGGAIWWFQSGRERKE